MIYPCTKFHCETSTKNEDTEGGGGGGIKAQNKLYVSLESGRAKILTLSYSLAGQD